MDFPPPLLHGNNWNGQDVAGWYGSEKFNGWRAYWDGERLVSRQGRDYSAPAWFLAGLPAFPLDGELWIGRGFDHNHVHKATAAGEWHRLKLVVFDVPGLVAEQAMAMLATLKPARCLKVVEFHRVAGIGEARAAMVHIVANGGEGVMLRKPGSLYRNTRTEDLLKLKP
jgi:DNA ligase 1